MSDRDEFEAEQVFRDRDLGDEDERVGPFPAEPAPGSPEAVEQAAETIRGLADEEDSEGSQARMDAALELLEGWGSNELSQPDGPENCGTSGAASGAPEGEQPAHTPGPWSTGRHRLRKAHTVPALGEWWECTVHVGRDNPGNAIAKVHMGGPGALQKDAEAVYANAELIARAPELLAENEALRAAVEAARRALGLSRCFEAEQVSDAVRGLVVEVERLRRVREAEVASWHEGSAALQAELNRISEQNQNLRATIDHLHETLRGERSKLMAGGKGYL